MRRAIESINEQKLVRIIGLVILDALLINMSAFMALFLRFELNYGLLQQTAYFGWLLSYSWAITLLTLGIFAAARLYNSLWEYAGTAELIRISIASVLAAFASSFGMYMLGKTMPRSCLLYTSPSPRD